MCHLSGALPGARNGVRIQQSCVHARLSPYMHVAVAAQALELSDLSQGLSGGAWRQAVAAASRRMTGQCNTWGTSSASQSENTDKTILNEPSKCCIHIVDIELDRGSKNESRQDAYRDDDYNLHFTIYCVNHFYALYRLNPPEDT